MIIWSLWSRQLRSGHGLKNLVITSVPLKNLRVLRVDFYPRSCFREPWTDWLNLPALNEVFERNNLDFGPIGQVDEDVRVRVMERDHAEDHLYNLNYRMIIAILNPVDHADLRARSTLNPEGNRDRFILMAHGG